MGKFLLRIALFLLKVINNGKIVLLILGLGFGRRVEWGGK